VDGLNRDEDTRRLILSKKADEIEEGLARILGDHLVGVSDKLKARYRLPDEDWDEVWSTTIWDLYRMRKNDQIAATGELEPLLYRVAGNRASTRVRAKVRRSFEKAGLLRVDGPETVADMDGLHLLEAIETHALRLPKTDQLVLLEAVKLLKRCGAKRFDQLPMITLVGIVNMKANPQISQQEAKEILFREWSYLYAFLQREGFKNDR